MWNFFRVVAWLEGFSFLGLFFFTMPLKYWGGLREPNIYVGYAHGALFVLYIALCLLAFVEKNWSYRQLIAAILASLLPFGTIYLDREYLAEKWA